MTRGEIREAILYRPVGVAQKLIKDNNWSAKSVTETSKVFFPDEMGGTLDLTQTFVKVTTGEFDFRFVCDNSTVTAFYP